MSTPLGTIARIYRYPVKSLAAEPLERATIEERGIAGDRRSALFVASQSHARSGKTYRGKENELLHTLDSKTAALALAGSRGVALDVRDAGPYFDASPISIVFDTWISALENVVYHPIDELRFRANIYVRAEAGFASTEEELIGTSFCIGDVRLRCTSAIVRCVTPTYDVPTGERDPVIARAIAVDLENILGIYCSIERGGEIVRGATISRA